MSGYALNEKYIIHVLGIDLPKRLIESGGYHSEELQRQIIREHLIFESFWSDVKSLPGRLKKTMGTYKQLKDEPERVSSFTRYLYKESRLKYNRIVGALEDVQDFLRKWEDKFPTFISLIEKLKVGLKKLYMTSNKLTGWKGMFSRLAAGLSFQHAYKKFQLEKVSAFAKNFKESLKGDLKDLAIGEIIDKIKEGLEPIVGDWKGAAKGLIDKSKNLMSSVATTTVKKWLGVAAKIYGGIDVVTKYLEMPISKLNSKIEIPVRESQTRRLKLLVKEILSEDNKPMLRHVMDWGEVRHSYYRYRRK
jgi:hypothetical protein